MLFDKLLNDNNFFTQLASTWFSFLTYLIVLAGLKLAYDLLNLPTLGAIYYFSLALLMMWLQERVANFWIMYLPHPKQSRIVVFLFGVVLASIVVWAFDQLFGAIVLSLTTA